MTNSITTVGNLTRDPELRFTNAGKAVVSFGIACSRRYKVGDEWQEQTNFFNVTAWDQLGENCAASLSKGTRIIVTGRVEIREYQGRDGATRQSFDIIADAIGPELRWATTVIERTERTDRNGNSRSEQQSRPPARPPAEPYYGGDEEPF